MELTTRLKTSSLSQKSRGDHCPTSGLGHRSSLSRKTNNLRQRLRKNIRVSLRSARVRSGCLRTRESWTGFVCKLHRFPGRPVPARFPIAKVTSVDFQERSRLSQPPSPQYWFVLEALNNSSVTCRGQVRRLVRVSTSVHCDSTLIHRQAIDSRWP